MLGWFFNAFILNRPLFLLSLLLPEHFHVLGGGGDSDELASKGGANTSLRGDVAHVGVALKDALCDITLDLFTEMMLRLLLAE